MWEGVVAPFIDLVRHFSVAHGCGCAIESEDSVAHRGWCATETQLSMAHPQPCATES